MPPALAIAIYESMIRIMKKQPSSVAAQAIVGVTTLAMFGAAGVMLWSILQGG